MHRFVIVRRLVNASIENVASTVSMANSVTCQPLTMNSHDAPQNNWNLRNDSGSSKMFARNQEKNCWGTMTVEDVAKIDPAQAMLSVSNSQRRFLIQVGRITWKVCRRPVRKNYDSFSGAPTYRLTYRDTRMLSALGRYRSTRTSLALGSPASPERLIACPPGEAVLARRSGSVTAKSASASGPYM